MLNTNSDTLRRVVQADLNLQPRSSVCWTTQLLSAFQGLRGCELYVRAVQTGRAITMQEFTANLKHRMRGVWRDAELVYPNALTRTITNWPLIILGMPPLYLEMSVCRLLYHGISILILSKHVMHNVSRLCLRAHTLKVEAASWLEDGSCECDQCPGEDEHVQNEVHTCSFYLPRPSSL